MKNKDEKVLLLTSGNGEIGRNILPCAIRAGFKVVTTTHNPPPKNYTLEDVEWIKVDFTQTEEKDPKTWREIIKEKGITHIVDASQLFQGKPDVLKDVNLNTPKAIIDATESSNVKKYIQISSWNMRDIKGEMPVWDLHRDLRDHLKSKDGLDWTEVAPSHVYHTNAGQGYKIQYHLMAALNVQFAFVKDAMMQPIHVHELSEGVVNLLENGKAKQETLAAVGPNSIWHNELLDRVQESLGISGKDFVIKVNRRIAKAIGRVMEGVNKVFPNKLTSFFDKNTVRLNMYDNTANPQPFVEATGVKLQRIEDHFRDNTHALLQDIASHKRLMILMHKIDPELHTNIKNLETDDWRVQLKTGTVHLYYTPNKGGIPEKVMEAKELLNEYHLSKGRINKGPLETGIYRESEKFLNQLKMTKSDLRIMSSVLTEFKNKDLNKNEVFNHIGNIEKSTTIGFSR